MPPFPQTTRYILNIFSKLLPYGVIESWNDLNPELYLSVHTFWLRAYGMWFNSYPWKSYQSWLQGLYTLIILFLVCILPGFGEINYLLQRRGNIGHIAEGLYLFLSEMYTYFKILVFWYNKEKILSLLKFIHCKEFKPTEIEHRGIIRKRILTARFVMNAYTVMCVGAVSGNQVYCVYVLILASPCLHMRTSYLVMGGEVTAGEWWLRNTCVRPGQIGTCDIYQNCLVVGILMPITENFEILPTNVEYPWIDVYKSPAYNLVYLHHIYYKPATCIIDGAMDTILAAFVASAIGQIEILTFNLLNLKVLAKRHQKLVPTLQKSKIISFRLEEILIRNILKKCIIHHTAIIRYVSMIEESFSLASALQFMLSVMVLCLVGVKFLSIENPSNHCMQIMWMAVYLTCMLTEVFLLCWFGNELILKSLELRNAAFNSPWLDIDSKSKIFIIIFMERCKRPLLVTAGKFFSLSLETYTYLINWSYKAFAVMRNMKNNVIVEEESLSN